MLLEEFEDVVGVIEPTDRDKMKKVFDTIKKHYNIIRKISGIILIIMGIIMIFWAEARRVSTN